MVDIILGTQWGDEGKGKIVDVFAENYDVVVRYQGGANAGHTVVVDNNKYILHLLPSGILHENTFNIIGNGVVLDLDEITKEIESLKEKGINITKKNFMISENAHVVMDYHKLLDKEREKKRGSQKLGTTARGIGPVYIDKYGRTGIRVRDLFDEESLKEKIEKNLEEKNFLFKNFYKTNEIKIDVILKKINTLKQKIKDYVGDATYTLYNLINEGKKILFEGAQGVLLDVDFGTYPFVTSSNPTIGGAFTGTGINYKNINKVIGITKSYQTRVGNGPFPTEMEKNVQEKTRIKGAEFGATTGRPRRCGWLDLVALKYASLVNGFTELILTKLDVLSIFNTIKVGIAYEYKGEKIDRFISDGKELYNVKPIYKELKGWLKNIDGINEYKNLPQEVKDYIKFIEDFVKVKVSFVSVGPDRKQILKI